MTTTNSPEAQQKQACPVCCWDLIRDGKVVAGDTCLSCRIHQRDKGTGESAVKSTEPEAEPRIRTATIRICQPCVDLVGEECHTPECVFCFRSVTEAKWLMDKMLIAPIIDGERFVLVDDNDTRADLPRATADTLDRELIEAVAEPWICLEEKQCEEAVAVHWDEMVTALTTLLATPRVTGEITVDVLVRREDAARLAELINDSIKAKGKFAAAILMMPPYPAPDCPLCGYAIDNEGLCMLDAAHTTPDVMAQVRAATRTEGEGEK